MKNDKRTTRRVPTEIERGAYEVLERIAFEEKTTPSKLISGMVELWVRE